MWIRNGGWLPIVIVLAVVVVGVLVLGPSDAGELLIGVASPADVVAEWWIVLLAWIVAIVGWLIIPILVGTLVGYLVTSRLSTYRAKTEDEISQ